MRALLLQVVCFIGSTLSAKILLMPAHHGSHVRFFSVVGEALQQDGHTVHALLGEQLRHHAEKRGLHVVSFGSELEPVLQAIQSTVFDTSIWGLYQFMQAAKETESRYCEHTLSQEHLYHTLESEKYDLVLIDNRDFVRCMYVIPHRLQVPYISMGVRHDPWSARVPAMPSAEGQFGMFIMTEDSTFYNRLLNTVATVAIGFVLPPSFAVDPTYLEKYAPNRPATTYDQIYRDSEMWFINVDTLCSDLPRVHAFHYHFIGGLGSTPAKPLPVGDLQSFADGAENGLIVVSFGSAISKLPSHLMDILITAFAELPQRVVMRHDGKSPAADIPANVMLSSWLPQNDLLGLNNTRLFITHGGNNGQLEGLFHGVPMLTLPIFGDQFYNAHRAFLHGHGLYLDLTTTSPEELRSTITEVITEPKYRSAVQKCSRIMRDLPEPRKVLTFWINHVLQFGSSHLKPSSMNLPLWKFFMLDVLAFIGVSAAILFVCSFVCCRCCVRRCCQQKWKKKLD